MGRNAGWLTAASALSRVNGGEGPSLIYLCEPVFDTEQFLKDVQEKLEQKDSVLVAISEGIHDSEGRYVSEQVQSDAQDQLGTATLQVLQKYSKSWCVTVSAVR